MKSELPASDRRPFRGDWIYTVLALFCVSTISLGLYLNDEVMRIVRGSVEINQVWANRLAAVWRLSNLANAVNAPGNDVFETRDTKAARAETSLASKALHQRISQFEADIALAQPANVRTDILILIGAAKGILSAMERNEATVFDAMDTGDVTFAATNMAVMDRKLADFHDELSRMTAIIRAEQRRTFDGQLNGAERLGHLEYAFSALVTALAGLVLWYGRKISRQHRAQEAEREANTHRLQTLTEELRASVEAAESATRAKSGFLAMMSHEIRTPMNGVLGMSGVLIDSGLADDQLRAAMTIRESAENLLHIINDVLDFSKLEAGAMHIERHAFEVAPLFRYAAEIVAPRIKIKPVELMVEIADDVPAHAISDPGRLRQIVLNFLGNAAKFTERGLIAMRVSMVAGSARLRVEVEDTGIGIAKEAQGRLFNSFEQADASTSRKFGGTGLGLAISRKLAEKLGGSIGVVSAPGEGSTFWFEVPIEAAKAGDIAQKTSSAAGVALDGALRAISGLGRPLRLLIAEDNATNLLVARSVLAKFGVTPDVAGNGLEALEAARKNDYDLVLMDIHMPQMDGIEATYAIRALPAPRGSVPIVALTANVFSEDVKRCQAAGMNGVVGKPFKTEELMSGIAAVLPVAAREAAIAPSHSAGPDAPPEYPAVDWAVLDQFQVYLGEKVVRDLIATFLASTTKLLEQLEPVAAAPDALHDKIHLAHAIKGSSASLGATALAHVAAVMERSWAKGERVDAALVQDAKRHFDAYKDQVAQRNYAA